MTDEPALIAAIIADKADDTRRLAYADWLDENDQSERAWLIRFQCDSRNQGPHDGTREYETIEKHIEPWFSLREITGRKYNRKYSDWYLSDHGPPNLMLRPFRERKRSRFPVVLPIRRGFISEAECSWEWWLDIGDKLIKRNPIEEVAVTSALPHFDFVNVGNNGYWGFPRESMPAEKLQAHCGTGNPSRLELFKAFFALRWPKIGFRFHASRALDIVCA